MAGERHIPTSEVMVVASESWKPRKLLLQSSTRRNGEKNVQLHEEGSLAYIKSRGILSSHHLLFSRILRGWWRKRNYNHYPPETTNTRIPWGHSHPSESPRDDMRVNHHIKRQRNEGLGELNPDLQGKQQS